MGRQEFATSRSAVDEMAATADTFIRGTVASWDISRNRGLLVADDGRLELPVNGECFDGFTVTAHAGLPCEFRTTDTGTGRRVIHVRPVPSI
jgi:hypothetical protein